MGARMGSPKANPEDAGFARRRILLGTPRLELGWVAPLEPKSSASTDSATCPWTARCILPGRLMHRPGSRAQVRLKCSSPSLVIVLRMRSPGLSQTCWSLGLPAMTPGGVPVKITSPGTKVTSCET